MKKQETVYVGTRDAVNFVTKHHGVKRVPKFSLFAFAENVDRETEVFAMVSEASNDNSAVSASDAKRLGIGEYHLEALQEKAVQEAKEYAIRPPYTVTLATRVGCVSYLQAPAKMKKAS